MRVFLLASLFLFSSCSVRAYFRRYVDDPREILKHEIELKIAEGRRTDKIGDVQDELDFIHSKRLRDLNMGILRDIGLEYIPDRTGGKRPIQLDYQYDSVSAFHRGGGDCNTLNRIIQVHRYTQGYPSYLVTYVGKRFIDNHATCVIQTKDGFMDCDYGYSSGKTFATLTEAVNFVAGKYKTRAIFFVVQDITWQFVEVK